MFVALLAVFGVFALTRFVDADEGYLLFAARLVHEGRAPYGDFFFPQPPLFPVVHAPLARFGWIGARLFGAALAAATGVVVVLAVRRRGLGARHEAIAAVLFGSTALVFAWIPLAKTYALATFCLSVAHLAASRGPTRSEPVRAVLVGVSLGLAASSRLYVAALAPVVTALFLVHTRRRGRSAGLVVLGFVGVGLAWTPWLLRRPDVAWFDLVEFHRRLFPLHGRAALHQKLEVLATLVGARTEDRFLGLQLAILTVLAIAGVRRRDPAAILLAAIVLLTFAPAPTYVQYFCIATPFLVELAVVGLAARRWDRGSVLPILLLGHAALGAVELRRHTVTGAELIGVGAADADRWRLSTVRAAARRLERFSRCGPVVAAWPGHLVGTRLAVWPGSESHFGVYAAGLLADPVARRATHVLTPSEITALFAEPGGPRVFVDAKLWAGALDASVLGGRLPRADAGDGVAVFSSCSPLP